MPVGLLEARDVGPGTWHVPVEQWEPILAVVCLPIWHHVWQGESLGSIAELVLRLLFLFDFLSRTEGREGLSD